jgi:hypothetical protein
LQLEGGERWMKANRGRPNEASERHIATGLTSNIILSSGIRSNLKARIRPPGWWADQAQPAKTMPGLIPALSRSSG